MIAAEHQNVSRRVAELPLTPAALSLERFGQARVPRSWPISIALREANLELDRPPTIVLQSEDSQRMTNGFDPSIDLSYRS